MQRLRLPALLAVAVACLALPSRSEVVEAGTEPFDCRAGLSNWRAGWSPEKKSWCCQSHNLGCRAPEDPGPPELAPPDDAADLDGAPGVPRSQEPGPPEPAPPRDDTAAVPDAERFGPGHCVSTWRTEASHCMVRTDCAQHDISRYPIAILCVDSSGGKVRHVFGEDSFAPEETFDTLIVCEECKADIGPQGRVGDTKALNATLQAFVREVDEIKQRAVAARIEAHSLDNIVHKVYRAAPDVRQVPDLFHCDAGRANWKLGWSKAKKCWCCTMRNIGCDSENVGCVTDVPVRLPTTPFDCAAGVQNHERGWSKAKKCWCCKTSDVGCSSQLECEGDVRTVAAPKPRFDCQAGLRNHERGWSVGKKIWCCRAHGLGCETKNVTRWQDPRDCREGLRAGGASWAPAKKYRCCQKHGIGCAPDDLRYDCFMGLHDTERLWSVQKREWCCHSGRVGCSWAEVKATLRRPRLRRTRTTKTAARWSPHALPGHREVVVTHDARASWPSASRAPASRTALGGHRSPGARWPPGAAGAAAAAAKPTAAPPAAAAAAALATGSALTEEAWRLDVESEARARRVARLRRQYQRVTSPELATIASIRARVAAAAELAAEADEVGRLRAWSGPAETEDEAAAREARARSRAGATAAALDWRQSLDQPRDSGLASRRSRLRDAAPFKEGAPSRAEKLDDLNSAAALVESYARSALASEERAAGAGPLGRGRRRAQAAAPDAPRDPRPRGGQVNDILWDSFEDDAGGAARLDAAAQGSTDEQAVWAADD